MKRVILSAAAALLVSAAPAFAAPQHGGSHGSSHGGSPGGFHGSPHGSFHAGHTSFHGGTHNFNHGWHGHTTHRTSHWTNRSHRGATNVHVRVNIGGLRANVRSPRRYHFAGDWHRPSGWYAHRWAYGDRLPGGWFGASFWLGDYVDYGLAAPPDGYQWIREGNDAVLVDVDTGEIIRVEYDVFY